MEDISRKRLSIAFSLLGMLGGLAMLLFANDLPLWLRITGLSGPLLNCYLNYKGYKEDNAMYAVFGFLMIPFGYLVASLF